MPGVPYRYRLALVEPVHPALKLALVVHLGEVGVHLPAEFIGRLLADLA
jgi:hypothetical protein